MAVRIHTAGTGEPIARRLWTEIDQGLDRRAASNTPITIRLGHRLLAHTANRYCAMGWYPVCTTSSFMEKMKTLWKCSCSSRRSSGAVLQLTWPILLPGEA